MPKKQKPVHPGEILSEEFMKPLELSQNKLAQELCVPVTRVGEIVNGRRSVTAETALRLARYFKNEASFWMNLQVHYDLEAAEHEGGVRIAREVRPHRAPVRAR
jgi:antitoxin HigA-1